MIIRKTTKIIKRKNTYRRGNSIELKVLVTIYWFLFIPVYKSEIIL